MFIWKLKHDQVKLASENLSYLSINLYSYLKEAKNDPPHYLPYVRKNSSLHLTWKWETAIM